MVFFSRLKLEIGPIIIKSIATDSGYERLSIVDIKNDILLYFTLNIESYFDEYREKFQNTKQYSFSGINLPLNISKIDSNNKEAEIIKIEFSSKKFKRNLKINYKNQRSQSIDTSKEIKSKKGKNISIHYIQDIDVEDLIEVNDYLLSVGYENGDIIIYGLCEINGYFQANDKNKTKKLIEVFENKNIKNKKINYNEQWNQIICLNSSSSLAIIDLQWSFDSLFLISLYYDNLIIIWLIEQNKKGILASKIHKIYLESSTIRNIISLKSCLTIIASSKFDLFVINYDCKHYDSINFLKNSGTESNFSKIKNSNIIHDENYFYELEPNFFKSSISQCERLFFIPKQVNLEINNVSGNSCLILYELELMKKEIKIFQKWNHNKSHFTCFSPYLFLSFDSYDSKKKDNFKIDNCYYIAITMERQQISIWKFYNENKEKKKYKKMLTITDFKNDLQYGLWIREYVFLIYDDLGKIWYIEFNPKELGIILTKN